MVIKAKPWFLYMLRCADGTLYTGISNRLEIRIENHSRGKGARYTRTRLPVELVYTRKAGTFVQALKQEYRLKQKPRKAKLKLAETWLKARRRKASRRSSARGRKPRLKRAP